MKKPNLFIIGAMKAGTTSLCRMLSQHDEIYMAEVKETFYFSNRYHDTSIADYMAFFAVAKNERYIAEGSADYTSYPVREGVAERIFVFNPASRFVYLVRDPFDRIISHYKHYVLHGKEYRGLLDALREDPEYLWRSYYAVQIRPYIQRFGREAVWIGNASRLRIAPDEIIGELLEWLELKPMPDCIFLRSVDT